MKYPNKWIVGATYEAEEATTICAHSGERFILLGKYDHERSNDLWQLQRLGPREYCHEHCGSHQEKYWCWHDLEGPEGVWRFSGSPQDHDLFICSLPHPCLPCRRFVL